MAGSSPAPGPAPRRERSAHRWERGSAWVGGLFSFFFVAAISILKASSNGLFLAQFDARHLAWLYLATPAAVGLTLGMLLRARGRLRLPMAVLGSALATIALYCVLPHAGGWSRVALYLFGEAAATTISVTLWEELNLLFDARTARRVFGPIGAAGMAGSVAGGFFVQHFAVVLGTVHLLPFAAGVFVVAGLAALLLRRRTRSAPNGQTEASVPADAGGAAATSRPGTWRAGLRMLASDRYPKYLAALTLLLSVLTVAVDFLFRSRAQAYLHDDMLTSVFGSVSILVGSVSFVFQVFLTGYLLTRLQLRTYLVGILAAVGAVAAVGLAGVGFAATYALKVVETSSSLSLSQPAIQLLYHPLPPGSRVVLRGLLDGVLKKVGVALGGLMLLVVLPLAGPLPLLSRLASEEGVIALVIGGAGLVLLLHREYRQLLLRRVRLSFQQDDIGTGLTQRGARVSLARALSAERASTVLVALRLAERTPGFDLDPHLPRLVAHPSRRVRAQALGLAGWSKDRPYFYLMSLLATGSSAARRTEEALSLARLAPEAAPEVLRDWLEHTDTQARHGAIEALYPLESGGDGPAHRALGTALRWARMAPAAEQIEVVELLGRLRDSTLAPQLKPFLRANDRTVRRAALQTAGQLRYPGLLPALLEQLADHATRQAALRALSCHGDEAVDLLEQWLNDRRLKLDLRVGVAHALQRIGTPEAVRVLLYSNVEDDPYLRLHIASALSKLHRQRRAPQVDAERVEQALQRRLVAFKYYVAVYRDLLQALPPDHPLMHLLADRLLQNLRVALHVVCLSFADPEPLAAIHIRWMLGTRHQRADAITLLESLLPSDLRQRLVEPMEAYDELRDEGHIASAPDQRGVEQPFDSSMLEVWFARRQRDARLTRGGGRARLAGPALDLSLTMDERDELSASASQAVSNLVAGRVQSGPPKSRHSLLPVSGAAAALAGDPLQSLRRDPATVAPVAARLRQLGRSRDLLLRALTYATLPGLDRALRDAVGMLPPRMEGDMPETLIDRVLFLQSVDLFEHQSVDDLLAIANIAEERRFEPDEMLYRVHDPSDALYIIVEGTVGLMLNDKLVMELGPGESFGQLSMLDRKPRPVTAQAKSALRVIALGRIEFFDLVSDRSELLQGVVEVLVKRIRALLDEIAQADR